MAPDATPSRSATDGGRIWKQTAMPVEHGGWGFLLEPIALGLGVAPSMAGAALAVAAIAAFLVRQPLRLALLDRRKGTRYPRTAIAERAALLFSLLALVSLAGAVLLGASPRGASVLASPLLPIVAAAPFALVSLLGDARGRSREALPEAAGAVALAASAAAIALAGEAGAGIAWGASLLLALRGVTSILYVRARIRLDRGLRAQTLAALGSHGTALAAVLVLVVAGWAPRLALAAFLVLWLRAAFGLSARRAIVRPQLLGLQEVRYAVVTLLVLLLGYRLGW